MEPAASFMTVKDTDVPDDWYVTHSVHFLRFEILTNKCTQ